MTSNERFFYLEKEGLLYTASFFREPNKVKVITMMGNAKGTLHADICS